MPFSTTEQNERRLNEDRVVWLTTVSPVGRPVPRLIWFFWNGSHILIYSLNTAARLANIRANPRVSVHFNSNAEGEDGVDISGTAEIVASAPLPSANDLYMTKYGDDIDAATDYDLATVDSDFHTLIRIEPLRAWTVA